MEYVRDSLRGGVDAHAAALEDPGLIEFFEQPFFATSWYDVWPLICAGHACASVEGIGFEDFVRLRARHQVERDLTLFRRLLIRVLSPRTLAIRMPAINASYFDFVSIETGNDAGEVYGVCGGLPGPIVTWYQRVSEEFIAEVLRRNGTRFNISWDERQEQASAHGVPTFTGAYRISFLD